MVLAKYPRQSSVFYIDLETFD